MRPGEKHENKKMKPKNKKRRDEKCLLNIYNMYFVVGLLLGIFSNIRANNVRVSFFNAKEYTALHFPVQKVVGLKPLGGSKVDSVFHPSQVDQTSTIKFWWRSG